MKAIIVAAGEGKRLQPLTLTCPKPMVPLLGKPILHHIWEIVPVEVDEVLLVVGSGWRGEIIRNYFGSEFLGKKIVYLVQESFLGTGHAVRLALPHLAPHERVLIMYADDLHHAPSIQKLLEHSLGMLVCQVLDPRRFGVVVTDKTGVVVGLEEKPENPKSDLAAIGVYVLDRETLEIEPSLQPNGEYYINDMILWATKNKVVHTVQTEFWHPIGYPEDVLTAEEVLKQRNASKNK